MCQNDKPTITRNPANRQTHFTIYLKTIPPHDKPTKQKLSLLQPHSTINPPKRHSQPNDKLTKTTNPLKRKTQQHDKPTLRHPSRRFLPTTNQPKKNPSPLQTNPTTNSSKRQTHHNDKPTKTTNPLYEIGSLV